MAHHIVRLTTDEEQKDILLADLYEAGTTGVSETELGPGQWLLTASFDDPAAAASFGVPVEEDSTDWVTISHRAWASRLVGKRFFLTPAWSDEPTPPGRWRIQYQDGAACGSGEHPSTRHSLEAIEEFLRPGMDVLDLGCGAGLLSHGAKLLGARTVIGVDIEIDSCTLTRSLAGVPVVQGTADCLKPERFDIVAANISATVLMHLADEILRVAKPGARIILAGFGVEEAASLKQLFALGPLSERIEGEWSCLVLDLPLTLEV